MKLLNFWYNIILYSYYYRWYFKFILHYKVHRNSPLSHYQTCFHRKVTDDDQILGSVSVFINIAENENLLISFVFIKAILMTFTVTFPLDFPYILDLQKSFIIKSVLSFGYSTHSLKLMNSAQHSLYALYTMDKQIFPVATS